MNENYIDHTSSQKTRNLFHGKRKLQNTHNVTYSLIKD